MYGKIFGSTFTGSMCGAGSHVFAVWGYCIANVSIDGFIELNPKMVAALIGDTEEKIKQAIDYLLAPDPHSESPAEEGRRLIQEGRFLYRVVNHLKYRNMRNKEERKEYKRLWMKSYRDSLKDSDPKEGENLRGQQKSTKVHCGQMWTQDRSKRYIKDFKNTGPDEKTVVGKTKNVPPEKPEVLLENLSKMSEKTFLEEWKKLQLEQAYFADQNSKMDTWLVGKKKVRKNQEFILSWLTRNLLPKKKSPKTVSQNVTSKKVEEPIKPRKACKKCGSSGFLRAKKDDGLPVCYRCPSCKNWEGDKLLEELDEWSNSLKNQGYVIFAEAQKPSEKQLHEALFGKKSFSEEAKAKKKHHWETS